MYRNCIFCSADLGANEAVERFPVGRSLAFDGARGRLWAVCPRCARWNLAPLEERWEAIDEAERLFRDTRIRVQSENVGMARLRDGTRLFRIGQALRAEAAVWRYGGVFARRAWREEKARAFSEAGKVILRSTLGVLVPVAPLALTEMVGGAFRTRRGAQVVHRIGGGRWNDGVLIRRWHLETATLAADADGGMELQFPYGLGDKPVGHAISRPRRTGTVFAIRGPEGRHLLARAVTLVNGRGGGRDDVLDAVTLLDGFASPDEFVRGVARERLPLSKGGYARLDRVDDTAVLNRRGALALEMAVHEETERRAMEGELAALEAMWKQAEEIAAIADALPDDLPPSDPPRMR